MWYLVAPEDSNNTDPSNLQSNIKSFIDNTNKTSVRLFLVAGGFFAEAYAEREGANSPAALFACGANYPSQEPLGARNFACQVPTLHTNTK